MASLLQEKMKLEVVEVEEGSEPDELWEILGGKGEYANAWFLQEQPTEDNVHPSRLFQCSDITGTFKVH